LPMIQRAIRTVPKPNGAGSVVFAAAG
jgi:hypothetical protein